MTSTSTAPNLYPPPNGYEPRFVQANGHVFGWRNVRGAKDTRYVLVKEGAFGSEKVLSHWPLTAEGWEASWEHLQTGFPELAAALSDHWERSVDRRAAAARAQEARATAAAKAITDHELMVAEGILEDYKSINDVILLGGFGLGSAKPGDHLDMWFTEKAIWVTPKDSTYALARLTYSTVQRFDFSGGTIQKGQRYMGGGFGLAGAAEGMLVAQLLTKASARTEIRTVIHLEASEGAAHLFTRKATPKQFDLATTHVRTLIRSGQASASSQLPPTTVNVVEALAQLAALRDSGALTNDEFTQAKARVLGNDT
jgi:hypothetical protein